jgi:hypothetical protein
MKKNNKLAAFLALASAMGSAIIGAAPVPTHSPAYVNRVALIQSNMTGRQMHLPMIRGGMAFGEAPPASYRAKNQRQIRLARRRAWAAGYKKAFA